MRITREDLMMEVATLVAQRGTCDRLQVGAVIAREGRVMSTGYNGPPAGMDHCRHTAGDTKCHRAIHAEINAIAAAAKYGTAINGCDLYVTHQPCLDCAKAIANSGIGRVFYSFPYRDQSGVEMLRDLAIDVVSME